MYTVFTRKKIHLRVINIDFTSVELSSGKTTYESDLLRTHTHRQK